MAKYEYKTGGSGAHIPPETIEANDYTLDTKEGKMTFYDRENNKIASFAIQPGAFVKLVGAGKS
jgi:hypothetical protein